MRTKALLLAAAFVAAGVSTSVAQVYSVNAVGYVNLTLPQGFSMVANPLNAGTGNNTVAKLFAPANMSATPTGSRVYVYNNATGAYATATFSSLTGAWTGTGANAEILPGDGVFFQNLTAGPLTATFVGEVMQGNLSTPIPQGFSIKSSQVPQAIDPDSTTLPPADRIPGAPGDRIYRFNPATGAYQTYQFSSLTGAWSGPGGTLPTFNVGESFFFQRLNPATAWTRTFSVNG
jgi:hypothetical protein